MNAHLISRNRNRDEINRDTSAPSLRPQQAAYFLGIGLSTLWAWTKQPGFPTPRKIGPKITVFDRDELIAWRDAQ